MAGNFIPEKNVPRSKKLASLGVWRLHSDWTEGGFGMTPWAVRARVLAAVSLRGMETTIYRSRSDLEEASSACLTFLLPLCSDHIDMRDQNYCKCVRDCVRRSGVFSYDRKGVSCLRMYVE